MNLRESIIQVVTEKQGCKVMELIAALDPTLLIGDVATNEVLEALELLVKEGELIEIEYCLPAYRIKSFYLPKETEVKIVAKTFLL